MTLSVIKFADSVTNWTFCIWVDI